MLLNGRASIQMIKCKGCDGEVEYIPLAKAEEGSKSFAGPALVHIPPQPCQWFRNTSAHEIIAYTNVATYKAERAIPLPGLANK